MKLVSVSLMMLFWALQPAIAQQKSILHFQKKHSFSTRSIRLPKNVSIVYFRDFKRQKIKGKLMRYEPPFLYLRTKSDTGEFAIHHKELVTFSYKNHYGAAYAPLIFIKSLYAVVFTPLVIVNPMESESIFLSLFGIASGYLVYLELNEWSPHLDVRHKWSLHSGVPLTRKEQAIRYKKSKGQ